MIYLYSIVVLLAPLTLVVVEKVKYEIKLNSKHCYLLSLNRDPCVTISSVCLSSQVGIWMLAYFPLVSLLF